MERIDGFTLEEVIARRGALPLEVCSSVGIMVGRVLNDAHNQDYMLYGTKYHGVIHRDLKPSNIMIDKKGTGETDGFRDRQGLPQRCTRCRARSWVRCSICRRNSLTATRLTCAPILLRRRGDL